MLTSTGGTDYLPVLQLEPVLLGGVIGQLAAAFAPVRSSQGRGLVQCSVTVPMATEGLEELII